MKNNWPTKKLDEKIAVREATDRQIDYGKILGLNLKSKSFRVADAMIADEIEKRCLKSIREQDLKKSDKVKYVGKYYKERKNKIFVINHIGKHGLIYFFTKDVMGNKKTSFAYAINLKKIKNE